MLDILRGRRKTDWISEREIRREINGIYSTSIAILTGFAVILSGNLMIDYAGMVIIGLNQIYNGIQRAKLNIDILTGIGTDKTDLVRIR